MAELTTRPWGTYRVLHEDPNYKVKEIQVLPGFRLSLQYHHKREENWTVVKGKAQVYVSEYPFKADEKMSIVLEPGQTVFIPKGHVHRVAAIGPETLVFIEVQTGNSFEEEDIVRLQDDYNRL